MILMKQLLHLFLPFGGENQSQFSYLLTLIGWELSTKGIQIMEFLDFDLLVFESKLQVH